MEQTSKTTANFTEQVNERVSMTYRRITMPNNTTINGHVKKDGVDVGSVMYNKVDNYLHLSVKPDKVTGDELQAIYTKAGENLVEIIGDGLAAAETTEET